MPTYTRGVLRDQLIFVKVNEPNVYYGFKTKDFASLSGAGISTADLIAIGHTVSANLVAGTIKFIGANSPKPPRVKKVINANPSVSQQGTVQTFCGINDLDTAETAGWDVVNGGRGVTFTSTDRTKTMAAEVRSGGFYCFPMNAADAAAFASTLGLQDPTQMSDAERAKAFTGVTKPRPPKVKRSVQGGGTRTAFCAYNKLDDALTAGWSLVKPEVRYGGPAPAGP